MYTWRDQEETYHYKQSFYALFKRQLTTSQPAHHHQLSVSHDYLNSAAESENFR